MSDLMTTYTDSGGSERFLTVPPPPMGTDLDAWEDAVHRLEDNARRFATMNAHLEDDMSPMPRL